MERFGSNRIAEISIKNFVVSQGLVPQLERYS